MKQKLLKTMLLLCALIAGSSSAWADEIVDELTSSKFAATETAYTNFSNVTSSSDAVYAGNSAKSSGGYIQLRSNNSNSGIVSTTSGGTVKSVTITVGSGSNTIDVYGSNTAYTAASDLYGNNKGTKIGSLTATGTITFTDDYEYVGIRSNSGSIYLSKVEITWEYNGTFDYTIDFESALSTYRPWNFSNVGTTNTSITAHGGSNKYGANINSSGNGLSTLSIQTKAKVAYPNVFTCYVSKCSTNTTSSTWKIQVSSNGSTWTDVATKDATSMTKGTWEEFTGDIKAAGHTDVFVRLSYDGGVGTAVRAVDDISLTTYTPKPTPTLTISAAGSATTVVAGNTLAFSATSDPDAYNGALTWSVTNGTGSATINSSTGVLTARTVGTVTVKVNGAETDNYFAPEEASYEVTITQGSADISFESAGQTLDLKDDDMPVVTLPTATVTPTTYDGTVSYTYEWTGDQDDIAVDATSVMFSGVGVFTYTLTAPATSSYTTSSTQTTYTITVTDTRVACTTLAFAGGNQTLDKDDIDQFEVTSTPATGADPSKITITYTSSVPSVATVDADGTVNALAGGETVITATATYETSAFKPASASYTLTVVNTAKTQNVLTIYDDQLDETTGGTTVFGNNISLIAETATGYTSEGTIAISQTNEAVANVTIENGDEITITPLAVGTSTITFSVSENANFSGNVSKTYDLTVTAPVGGSTAYAEETVTLDFTTNDDWNFPTTGTNTTEASYTSGGKTIVISAPNNYYFDTDHLFLGKNGAKLTLPAFSKDVTRIDVVGTSGASSSVTQNIYVGETAVSTATTGAKVTNIYNIANNYQAAGTIYTLKVTNSNNTRIASIIVHFAGPNTVNLNASGYATYCSQYPLDFSDYETADYSAWKVTSFNSSTIAFSQVTGKVKGGTGLLLKGTANATISLTSSDSNNELSDNKLVGTLAPTYLADETAYGLSGNKFYLNSAGTIGANKAYLPVANISSNPVKALTIVFEGADGVKTVETVSAEQAAEIFNLAGQRLSKAQRGINIINGRKVIVK